MIVVSPPQKNNNRHTTTTTTTTTTNHHHHHHHHHHHQDFESFLPCVRALSALVVQPLSGSPERRRLTFIANAAKEGGSRCLCLTVFDALATEGARLSGMSQPLRQVGRAPKVKLKFSNFTPLFEQSIKLQSFEI